MVSYAWYLSWNVYHKFIYQCKMIKLFLGIFTRIKRIFRKIFNRCFCHRFVADRPGRPTAWVDRTKGRSTLAVDRRAQACARLADTGTVGRAADRTRELCSLYLGGRPSGWPDQRVCSLYLGGRPGGRPGRSTASLSGCQISQRLVFCLAYINPISLGFWLRFLELKFPDTFSVLNKFSK